MKVKVKDAQWCLTLCDPMDCRLPGSSVHGIFQARILEWVAISFSRRSSQGDWTQVSCIAGGFFTVCDTSIHNYCVHLLYMCIIKDHSTGFPGGWLVKNPPVSAGDTGSIPGLGRSWGATKPVLPHLLSLCFRARESKPLSAMGGNWSPHALEPMLCNKRSHHNEKPTHGN